MQWNPEKVQQVHVNRRDLYNDFSEEFESLAV